MVITSIHSFLMSSIFYHNPNRLNWFESVTYLFPAKINTAVFSKVDYIKATITLHYQTNLRVLIYILKVTTAIGNTF